MNKTISALLTILLFASCGTNDLSKGLEGVFLIDQWDSLTVNTHFSCHSDAERLWFRFDVMDSIITLTENFKDERDVEPEDRVELFFAPTEDLSKDYYCAEMDPNGHILDYKGKFYRDFDFSWNFKTLIISADYTPQGYTLKGSVEKQELESLGINLKKGFWLGVFQADFKQDGSVNWFSLKKGISDSPDFHTPGIFTRCKAKTAHASSLKIKNFVTSTMEEPWTEGINEESEITETVILNSHDTLQSIEGFGVSFSELGAQSLALLSEADRNTVMDELFKPGVGANLTINRCPVGANDFSIDWYSYNETDGDFDMENFSIDRDRELLLPLIKEALKRNPDMKIWASPWCPPTWMKRNHHYAMRPDWVNDLTEAGRGYEGQDMFIQDERYFEAYADYFRKYIEAYRNEGVNISMVMPQNEANSDQNFPSCCWTSAGLCRFLRHLCPKMSELGTEVYFGTCERPNVALIDTVLTDPEVGKYIKGVGFQWAGRTALPKVKSSYEGLDFIMTEQECGNGLNDWKGAAHSWDLMKHYLGKGVSIYDYWNISLKENGLSRWAWRQNSLVVVNPDDGTFRFSIEYYLLKHTSHFVQKGAKVIDARAYDDVLAFRNPDDSIVIIAANKENTAKRINLNIDGNNTTVTLKPLSFSTIIL